VVGGAGRGEEGAETGGRGRGGEEGEGAEGVEGATCASTGSRCQACNRHLVGFAVQYCTVSKWREKTQTRSGSYCCHSRSIAFTLSVGIRHKTRHDIA